MMRDLLVPYGFLYCAATIYKYMSKLGLRAVVRRKKPEYKRGNAHKTFPNLLNQNFDVDDPNEIWCTDFTYLFLQNGNKRYNCTILDLYDRSVVSSITDLEMTSDLAIRTLRKALADNPSALRKGVILHSDQGSQFTSKKFTETCEELGIKQSMSHAGCPYDNAPMERYFNTLKNELTKLYSYSSGAGLEEAVSDFAYTWYNHGRPHSYNHWLTPMQKRRKSLRDCG